MGEAITITDWITKVDYRVQKNCLMILLYMEMLEFLITKFLEQCLEL
jgi:hypothetical protein